VSEADLSGPIPDKPVFIAYASGGAYPPGNGAAVMNQSIWMFPCELRKDGPLEFFKWPVCIRHP